MTQDEIEKIIKSNMILQMNIAGICADIEERITKAVQDEREACAKLFDDRDNGIGFYEPHEPAEIIRARGEA